MESSALLSSRSRDHASPIYICKTPGGINTFGQGLARHGKPFPLGSFSLAIEHRAIRGKSVIEYRCRREGQVNPFDRQEELGLGFFCSEGTLSPPLPDRLFRRE